MRGAADGAPRWSGSPPCRRGQEPALLRIRPMVSRPAGSRAGSAGPDLRPRDTVSAGSAVPACVVPDPAGGRGRDRAKADRSTACSRRAELRRRPCNLPRIPRRADQADPAPRLDPKARHARLLDILRRMILAQGAETSVSSSRICTGWTRRATSSSRPLVDAVAGTKMMLVVNYRPGYSAAWMRRPHFEELPLADLRPAETDAILEELIGGHPRLRDIRRSVARRSAGNPFFAEELVRSLAEKDVISGEQGAIRSGRQARRGDPSPDGPGGARRAHRPARRAAQDAAADRRDHRQGIPAGGARAGCRSSVSDIETSLGRAVRRRADPGAVRLGRPGFAFVHPLTQEVAYATQLRARRSALHADGGGGDGGVLRRPDSTSSPGFSRITTRRPDGSQEAANQAARAARWVGTTNPAQAIKHWHQVRGLLRDAGASPASDGLRAMASGQIAMLGWREGHAGRGGEGLRRGGARLGARARPEHGPAAARHRRPDHRRQRRPGGCLYRPPERSIGARSATGSTPAGSPRSTSS